ncbi:hypothetical protein BOX15_Mlig021316g1 [Macrostomum lignano]|uniref:Sema domain-containing protein n=1 Tax=Macrostomum lignano TaxID=282301 RepID=A0A267GSL6_9PLAT|nr:hypothetical protein BOX15_Mlig021316g1 [Macrostomum lignano]
MQQSLPRHQRLLLLLLLIILQLGGSVSSSEVPSSTNSYQTSYNGNNFSHLELYTDPTGRELVLVAQKNALIRLSPDLSQSSRTLLGPLNDSKTCMPHQIHQGMPNCHLAPMDNYIRAVDIVNGSMLHFCMSYLSGSCASVRLTALDAPLLVNTTAVAEVLSESVDGLLCRNPESDIFLTVSDRSLGRGGSVPDALYLTMPFCASRRDKIEPTLAIVDPQTLRKFAVSEEFNFFQAEIVSRRDFIRPGRLAHHASFRRVSKDARGLRRSCVYLVLTARAGPLRRARLRLARLCSADLSLSNYVEALVDCGGCGTLKGRDEVDCVGRAAAVAPAGRHLARHLNISSTSDTEVLFLTSSHNNRSGVCAVRMLQVDQLLDLILDDCRQGRPQALYGPTYLRDELPCSQVNGASGSGGASSSARGIWAGIVSANPDRVIRAPFMAEVPEPADEVTAVASVATRRGDQLIYSGTLLGSLLGYRIDSSISSLPKMAFFQTQIGQKPILAVRTGEDRLLALTESQVHSQPYANCEAQYFTCSTCLSPSNPHCLWSNLPGSNGGCRTVKPREQYNLTAIASLAEVTEAERCARVTLISGEGVDVDQLRQGGETAASVVAEVANAPLGLPLHCQLGVAGNASEAAEVATVQYNGTAAVVTCGLSTARLAALLGDRSSRQLTLQLSVNSNPGQSALASAELFAFACSRHSSCNSCTEGGRGRCGWCVPEGRCLTAGSSCGVDSFASESLLLTRSRCPVIHLASGASEAPMLPSGASQGQARLVYAAAGLQAYMRSLYCRVSCPGTSALNLSASLSDDGREFNCSIPTGTRLTYASKSLQNVTCSVRFYWTTGTSSGGRRLLDSDGPAGSLVLYKCQAMAGSCDACVLTVSQRYGCVWCGDSCAVESSCSASRVPHGGLCANPRLLSVRPAKLAPRPGLRLRVDGANLGNSPDSLSARLLADSAPALDCRIDSLSYRPGRSFVCHVDDTAPMEDVGDYRLEVSVLGLANGSTATAVSGPLPVRLPSVDSVTPATVQRGGRVVVRLRGANLDAGSDLFVSWRLVAGNNTTEHGLEVNSAEVLERSHGSMTVKLATFNATGTYRPVLSVQGSVVQNPTLGAELLLQVMPNAKLAIASDELRSALIPSGGLDFVISGQGLSNVRRAALRFVELSNASSRTGDAPLTLESPCHLVMPDTTSADTERLVCPSPRVPISIAKEDRRPRRQRRSFIEGSQPVRRFSATILLDELSYPYSTTLTLFPNPIIEPLSSRPPVLLQSSSDARQTRKLQLFGRGLLQSVRPADIRVTVGSAPCQGVTQVRSAASELEVFTCQFRLTENDLGQALSVRASIGRLNFELGYLTFVVEFPWSYVYVIAGIGSMLLIAAAIACCIHAHQRSRKRSDKVNGIEVHLNKLEAKVSKSCRDAFAELQLNSSPDSTEDSTAPAPVRTYGQFAAYSCFAERYKERFIANDCLFADVATEEAANGHDSAEVRKALGQLRHLLLNEDFLLTLIAALESRTDSFMHQERNHFGSLVSALLFSDPTYFTRILTALIRQLIERKRDAHDNCKVTFRRCDSVAERLLPNWLAFLMYDHLASRVAEPLYRLSREMRLQIYRGPVDQVTEDSRYTINEQKLLKKEITFRPMILVFYDRFGQFGNGAEPLQCKVSVLDCDTVRQAKEKILDAVYSRLRVPASRRLPASRFDLIRFGTPPTVAAVEPTASGERGIQVLQEMDDIDVGGSSDGMQRLRRMSCLNLIDPDASTNNNGGGNAAGCGPFWVYLRPRKNAGNSIESTRRGLCKGASYADIGSLPGGVSSKSLQDMKHISSSYSRLSTSAPRQYHLIQPSGPASHTLDRGTKKRRHGGRAKKGDADGGEADNEQIVSEVLYPILLSTKKNLVNKITDLFAALFPTDQELQQQLKQLKRQSTVVSVEQDQQLQQQQHQQQVDVPQCLIYLFDLLDQLAKKSAARKPQMSLTCGSPTL